MPGGWAEESGLDVRPVRLLGILDKKFHDHPPESWHIYKVFILCEIIGGVKGAGLETSEVGFFTEDHLPTLSTERNTEKQIQRLFEMIRNDDREVMLD
ncbi:hypothetical protein [Cohnella luojiensis]|uniref:hypothetical protein n=1 Tax=Cohnella luojiensis TaxID=652876 RepID=UPI00196A3A98